MKSCIRNVCRLRQIFIPLLAVVLCGAFLLLVCGSVKLSAKDATKSVGEKYNIPLTLTVKENFGYVKGDNGRFHRENLNKELIGSGVLKTIGTEKLLSDLSYVTNIFVLPTRIICSEEQLENISHSISQGQGFTQKQTNLYELNVIGLSSDSLIKEFFGTKAIDAEVSYLRDGGLDNGIIVSKRFYDLYNSPSNIVIGYFKSEAYGFEVTDENGNYVLSEVHLDNIDYCKGMPDAPKATIPIAGYYSSAEKHSNYVICNVKQWEEIYAAKDYYDVSQGAQSFYRNDVSAIDEIGINELDMVLSDASQTASVIKSLMDKGINAESYAIVADDYEYKFVASRLKSTERFSSILLTAVAAFAVALVVIIIPYSAKRRQGEIYTLRTLGKNSYKIAAQMTAEIAVVTAVAILLAVALGGLFGNVLCDRLNLEVQNSAKASVSNLSSVSQLMKDSDVVKAQLEKALDSFLKLDAPLKYTVPLKAYALAFVAWLASVLLSFGIFVKKSKRNLMQRGG